MLTRREFIRTAALFALAPHILGEREREIWVNDVHSQLNRTRVRELLRPRTRDELAEIVRSASRKGLPISVSGCRHSMGGQQFATDSICIDTRPLARVISFDQERGLIEAEGGIQWPKLIRTYLDAQQENAKQWGIAQEFLYGDFQFSVDEKSPDFLQRGVFSCYEPIDEHQPIVDEKELRDDDWLDLLRLAYTDRGKAFKRYSDYYLSTNGQTYWSDTSQLSAYLPNYAQKIHEQIRGKESSLIITEIYVPRRDLPSFLAQAAELLRSKRTIVIYGTVRLIEKDDESFLAWAKESYACVIFNLLTPHTSVGIEASARSFRSLIDLAIARRGSYYLTYHKFAKPEQVMTCYPQFKEFLGLKKKYDPTERFQSDWYRYYRKLFAT